MYIDWLQLIGRLHPVVLHLPIGIFVGIFAFELTRCLRRDERAEHAPFVLILFSAITSVTAVITGLLLSREGYSGLGVEFHRWLSILTALLAILLAVLRNGQRGKPRRGYCFTLALQLVTLGITGHLGGVITHGESFLTEPFRKRTIGETPAVDPYLQVASIFESKCISCHNPQKSKGGLQMHTLDALMRGGDSGPCVVMGAPDDSELLFRIMLPLDDDEHMPPPNKPQLSAAEVEIIRAWIAGTETPSTGVSNKDFPVNTAATPTAPGEALIGKLREAGVHVSELAPGTSRLWIDFSVASSPLSSDQIEELLDPIAPWVEHLTLARCEFPISILNDTLRFDSLTRLDLRSATITDDSLRNIGQLPSLRELVVTDTPITDAAANYLSNAKLLRKLYVWNTKFSAHTLEELAHSLPDCDINQGAFSNAQVLESETELKLTSDAPLPGHSSQAVSLKPENTKCPVSGSPIDPRYTIVYEGRAIGFCCPNCPKTFWQDPAGFLSKLHP